MGPATIRQVEARVFVVPKTGVFGVPSSGTRVVCRAITAATDEPTIHGHAHSLNMSLLHRFVLITRSPPYLEESYTKRFGVRDASHPIWLGLKDRGFAALQAETFRVLMKEIGDRSFAPFSYEAFVAAPEESIKGLCGLIGLEWLKPHGIEVYDGNEAYRRS